MRGKGRSRLRSRSRSKRRAGRSRSTSGCKRSKRGRGRRSGTRSRHSRGGRGKTMKRRCSGKYGKNVNPFFNFLKYLKGKYKGYPATVIAQKGAEIWNQLSCKEKQEFIRFACKAQKKCKKGTKRKRRRSSSKRNKYQYSFKMIELFHIFKQYISSYSILILFCILVV